MKNFKTLTAILFLCLAVVSCSSDDEGTVEPTNADKVIGLWKLQSATQDGNPVVLGTCDILSTIRFTESNMFTQLFYSGTNCATIQTFNGTYTIDDVNITVNSGSTGRTTRIITLNETNLSIEFDENGILVVNNYLKQL